MVQTVLQHALNGFAQQNEQVGNTIRMILHCVLYVPEPSDESDDSAEAKVEVYDTTHPHSSSGERHPPHQNSSSGSLSYLLRHLQLPLMM